MGKGIKILWDNAKVLPGEVGEPARREHRAKKTTNLLRVQTSYPSEEAMRNHARKDHKGHKHVRAREAKSKNFREDTGTTCPTCKKSYTSQRRMRQHMKTAHGATLGSQICNGCEKRFPTKLTLRGHQRTNCD